MERDTSHYIGVRGRMDAASFGGPGVNMDDRLWNQEGGPFVLTLCRGGKMVNYAVADADAEAFIARVLEYGKEAAASGSVPNTPSPLRPEVTIGMELHPFPDAALLKQWLEELGKTCCDPLSPEEYYRYTHPLPPIPEGELEVTKMVEQQILPYRPAAMLGPGPDNCRSELVAEDGFAVLSVFRNGMHLEYILPPELLPEVNAAAKELLKRPGNGAHREGDEDAWLKLKGREEEFDLQPEDVLQLFKALVGRCGDPLPRKERMDFYKVYLPSVREKLDGAWDCPLCAWKRNTGGWCQGCGAKKEDIPSGRAASAPKPRAEMPWRCNCGAEGNVGGYCAECGRAYDYPPLTGRSTFGYRKGQSMFGGIGMMGVFGIGGSAPAPEKTPPKQSAPGPGEWFCTACGARNSGRFCTECGKARYG